MDLCIVFVKIKFFSRDREKALPIDQSQSKEISSVYQYKGHCIQIGTPLILYSGAIEVCNQRAESM
jgi:hypothetical protein